jgi:hypothetical protein
LSFGVGIHHAGLHEQDRRTVEQLFVNQKIQVRFFLRREYITLNPTKIQIQLA